MDVTELLKQLGILAEKSSEARAFILALMLQLLLLAAFMMFGVRGLVQRFRARNDAESDDDVTAKDTTIVTLAKILDKSTELLDRIDQKIERVDKRGEQLEAGIAGISATTALSRQADVKSLETDDVLINLIDRIDKRIAAIRTRDEATNEKSALTAHVTESVKPVLEQVKANAVTVGAIDTKADDLLKKVDLLPPHLDALKLKMDELPVLVQQAYTALVAENKALTEQKTQAEAANVVYKIQVDQLTADLAAVTDRLRVAESTIAALPKAPVISADTSVPPGDVPPAPEGVKA